MWLKNKNKQPFWWFFNVFIFVDLFERLGSFGYFLELLCVLLHVFFSKFVVVFSLCSVCAWWFLHGICMEFYMGLQWFPRN